MKSNKNSMVVKMKVHAGSGWEGHVVYTAVHPQNPEITYMASNLTEIEAFCDKHGLLIDEDFKALVLKHFIYEQKTGLVIPATKIDETFPIKSATEFLKKYFADYYRY